MDEHANGEAMIPTDEELEKRVAEVIREGTLKGGLEGRVVALLRTVRNETIEACVKVAKTDYVFGKDVPIDQFKGWRIGTEQAAQSIATAIRNQRSSQC